MSFFESLFAKTKPKPEEFRHNKDNGDPGSGFVFVHSSSELNGSAHTKRQETVHNPDTAPTNKSPATTTTRLPKSTSMDIVQAIDGVPFVLSSSVNSQNNVQTLRNALNVHSVFDWQKYYYDFALEESILTENG